jgi:hypothetical protein
MSDGVTATRVQAIVDQWEHVLDPADPTRCLVHPGAVCFPRITADAADE